MIGRLGLDKSTGGVVTGIMTGGVSNLFSSGGGGNAALPMSAQVWLKRNKQAIANEQYREKNVLQQRREQAAGSSVSAFSKWAPLFVVGGLFVVGVAAVAAASRKRRDRS